MRAVINFHSIDNSGSVLSYPGAQFAELLAALAAAKLPVVDLDTLLQARSNAGIALTFDDGMASLYTNALPVLKEHGVSAHLFLTVGAVGGDNRWPGQPATAPRFPMLSWDQLEACQAAGVLIESHTQTHPDLRRLGDAEIARQCRQADTAIAARSGRRPGYFAYPYGHHDRRVRRALAGRYRGCFTTELRPLSDHDDAAALPRLDSYYLRNPQVYRRLDSPSSRAYLALRRLLRRLRGSR